MNAPPARKTTRTRGFDLAWRPRTAKQQRLLAAVLRVLEEYAAYLPLTIRQIFYRLVATANYDKTENAYKRLGELLGHARRAELIAFDAVRDDGFTARTPPAYAGPQAFLDLIVDAAGEYRRDRQAGQARRLAVWCEAAGMVPQLEDMCVDYGVPVYSSGGFDSVTVKHDMAKAFAAMRALVEVLHIGDHDPSGVHVFSSLDEDVSAFAAAYGGAVLFTRLAVTPAQIAEYALPTAPPKTGDNRTFSGETVQAEALAPDVLAGIVRAAIEWRQDDELRQGVIEQEADERARLVAAFRQVTL